MKTNSLNTYLKDLKDAFGSIGIDMYSMRECDIQLLSILHVFGTELGEETTMNPVLNRALNESQVRCNVLGGQKPSKEFIRKFKHYSGQLKRKPEWLYQILKDLYVNEGNVNAIREVVLDRRLKKK